jgi:hypothetical protein
MTEAEWWAATAPRTPIEWLCFDARATDRKLRLFSVAGCEPLRRLVGDPRLLAALDSAEAFADGHIDAATLRAVHHAAWETLRARHARVYGELSVEGRSAESVCLYPAAQDPHRNRDWYRTDDGAPYALPVARFIDHPRMSAPFPRLVRLLHDVFGPLPFREAIVPPAWLTSEVLSLARGIYDEKAFDRLLILAEALQDAGCDNEDLLNHCRGAGPQVRGCWVVDLVLGKE